MTEYEQEPTLEDVLSYPLVNAVMIRDRLDVEEVRTLLTSVRTLRMRRPPGEAKAAAAHEWMSSLNQRGRWMALRYTARDTVIDT